jgi:hypothetical protein
VFVESSLIALLIPIVLLVPIVWNLVNALLVLLEVNVEPKMDLLEPIPLVFLDNLDVLLEFVKIVVLTLTVFPPEELIVKLTDYARIAVTWLLEAPSVMPTMVVLPFLLPSLMQITKVDVIPSHKFVKLFVPPIVIALPV